MTIGRFETQARCNVELNNGMTIDVITSLEGYASVRVWREDMHPDGLGYYETFVDILDDIEDIKPLYNDEFEPVDDIDENLLKNTYIVKVNSVSDNADWELDEDYCDE